MSTQSRADSARRNGSILLPRLPGQLGAIALVNQQIERVMGLDVVLQRNCAHGLVLISLCVATGVNSIDHSPAHVDGIALYTRENDGDKVGIPC